MARVKVSAKAKKYLGKISPKIDVMDEWEVADIDRDEQVAGLKRRDRRYREIALEQKRQMQLEQKSLSVGDKMDRDHSLLKEPTELEMAWIRCDYLLYNIMMPQAYEFMEYQRLNDTDTYKKLYRKFMSRYMMENAQIYVDFFAQGGKTNKHISFPDVVKEYKKIKGIQSKIAIVHKGEKEYEL
jgi:hypothetical protein